MHLDRSGRILEAALTAAVSDNGGRTLFSLWPGANSASVNVSDYSYPEADEIVTGPMDFVVNEGERILIRGLLEPGDRFEDVMLQVLDSSGAVNKFRFPTAVSP